MRALQFHSHVGSDGILKVEVPVDDAAADAYGTVRADLERVGTPIGPNDLMIAAIAQARGLTLVTHNVGEFQRVKGLTIEDWLAPINSAVDAVRATTRPRFQRKAAHRATFQRTERAWCSDRSQISN